MPTPNQPPLTPQDLINEFYRLNLSEVEGLNLLHRRHAISDNVIFTHDIATADLVTCINYLRKLEP